MSECAIHVKRHMICHACMCHAYVSHDYASDASACAAAAPLHTVVLSGTQWYSGYAVERCRTGEPHPAGPAVTRVHYTAQGRLCAAALLNALSPHSWSDPSSVRRCDMVCVGVSVSVVLGGQFQTAWDVPAEGEPGAPCLQPCHALPRLK